MSTEAPFSTPRRQAPAAILFILLAFAWRLVKQFWPIVLAIYFSSKQESFATRLAYAGAVISGFSMIASVYAYFRLYYYVEGEDLILEKGVMRRTRLSVPINRIQTINFEQGPLHRFLGVIKVNIDTAGSQGNEFSLSALRRGEAETLRNFLLEEKKTLAPATELEEEAGEDIAEPQTNEVRLLQRSAPDLFKIGLSRNHLRTGGAILGFFGAILTQLDNIMEIDYEEQFVRLLGINFSSYSMMFLAAIPVFILISVLGSMVTSVLVNFNLSLWRSGKGFRLESGLLNRKQQVLPFQRLQFIKWQTQPLMQVFGFWNARLYQASSVRVRSKQTARIPGSSRREVMSMIGEAFSSDWYQGMQWQGISRRYVDRRFLYFGLLPAVLALPLIHFYSLWMIPVLLLWPPVIYLYLRRYQQRYRMGLNDEFLHLHSGSIATIEILLPVYKVQAVALRQTPYQRKHGVADLQLFTAAGGLSIPYLDLAIAQEIQNFVLYKVEAEKQEWM